MGKKRRLQTAIILVLLIVPLVPMYEIISGSSPLTVAINESHLYQKFYPYENKAERAEFCNKEQTQECFEKKLLCASSAESFSSLSEFMNSSWQTKSYNAQRIGRTTASTADNPGTEKWRFITATDGIDSGAAIDREGTIYVGSRNYYLYALNTNGSVNWMYKTNGNIFSVPAIAVEGTIYVSSCDNYLYALRPDGTLKWRYYLQYLTYSSPVLAENETIYISTAEGKVFAVNPNGTSQWCYDTMSGIYGDPSLGPDGTIYVGTWDNYLNAINPNGTLKWRFHTGNHVKGVTSIAPDGTIYFGSWDGYLYALNPNGTQKWRCHVGSGTETTPAIAQDGTIYVGGDALYAVNPNGTMRWEFPFDSQHYIFSSCPAISAEGTIYAGVDIGDAAGGEILAVNPDGTQRWRKVISDEWVDSSPAIGPDGTVYIGSTGGPGGYLHAFGKIESNQPPQTPIVAGDTVNFPGRASGFQVTAYDPDRNPIRYYIDWGDGTIMNWTRECASGEGIFADHSWSQTGNYTVLVKTRDVCGAENQTHITVTIEGKGKHVFILFGKIANYTYIDWRNEIQFSSVRLWVIEFKPTTIRHLISGEKIYTGKPLLGILRINRCAIGLFEGYIEP